MDINLSHSQDGALLSSRVLGFARFLRAKGYKVIPGSVEAALRALTLVDIFRKADFFSAVRATMVTNDLEWHQFPHHFEEYWNQFLGTPPQEKASSQDPAPPTAPPDGFDVAEMPEPLTESADEEGEQEQVRLWMEGVAYSPVSHIESKDLAHFDKQDVKAARLAIKGMLTHFKPERSRRLRRTPRRDRRLDFGHMMRKSLKFHGLPLELFYRERRKRLRRLVVLADVSGSMERYARFVIPFLLGLRGVGARAEVFVFSTTLTRITHLIHHLDIEQVLEKLPGEVDQWAGGTRIGFSLQQFNQRYGPSLLTGRTLVVILSDGWDLGAKELLRRAMEAISSKASSVIWLNPLFGDPGLSAMSGGMTVAVPYVDYLLPAMSLGDLKRAGRIISRMMVA